MAQRYKAFIRKTRLILERKPGTQADNFSLIFITVTKNAASKFDTALIIQ